MKILRGVIWTVILHLLAVSMGFSQIPKRGVVVSDRPSMRAAPAVSAPVVEQLFDGDFVEILERSVYESNIGKMSDYWYKVRSGERFGWTFGYFISFENISFNPIQPG